METEHTTLDTTLPVGAVTGDPEVLADDHDSLRAALEQVDTTLLVAVLGDDGPGVLAIRTPTGGLGPGVMGLLAAVGFGATAAPAAADFDWFLYDATDSTDDDAPATGGEAGATGGRGDAGADTRDGRQ